MSSEYRVYKSCVRLLNTCIYTCRLESGTVVAAQFELVHVATYSLSTFRSNCRGIQIQLIVLCCGDKYFQVLFELCGGFEMSRFELRGDHCIELCPHCSELPRIAIWLEIHCWCRNSTAKMLERNFCCMEIALIERIPLRARRKIKFLWNLQKKCCDILAGAPAWTTYEACLVCPSRHVRKI